jgi:diguanylate cyclase (GGDEF)-like protein
MMKTRYRNLGSRVNDLLADPQYAGHPLREALDALWQHAVDQLERLERISSLADAYQSLQREREIDITDRFDRELRRLSKVVRISDGYQTLMRESSRRDPLTNLLNRRAAMERLSAMSREHTGDEPGFVVAMLDVDHFKRINDDYGHEAGDRVLVELADLLRATVREEDLVARWGGEEFLVLLPEATLEDGEAVVDRLLAKVRGHALRVGQHHLTLTVSVGLAQHVREEDIGTTLSRADRALYLAKKAGRDRLALETPSVA